MIGNDICKEAGRTILPSFICENLGSNLYRDHFSSIEVSLGFPRSLQANVDRVPPGRQLLISSIFTKLLI